MSAIGGCNTQAVLAWGEESLFGVQMTRIDRPAASGIPESLRPDGGARAGAINRRAAAARKHWRDHDFALSRERPAQARALL
jgi:hypothetical protein